MIFPQRMIDASPDVRDHEDLGFLPVAIECALKPRLVFARGDFATEHHRDHLIAKVAVVYISARALTAARPTRSPLDCFRARFPLCLGLRICVGKILAAPHKTGVSAATVKHRR
jgi:hypothetical protein